MLNGLLALVVAVGLLGGLATTTPAAPGTSIDGAPVWDSPSAKPKPKARAQQPAKKPVVKAKPKAKAKPVAVSPKQPPAATAPTSKPQKCGFWRGTVFRRCKRT